MCRRYRYLALLLGIQVEVAVIVMVGNMLEAAIPVYLLRRFELDPRLAHLRDALLFIGIGPVLGPLFSATSGSLAFQLINGGPLEFGHLWLLWWLGNSIGMLIVGGFGLIAVSRGSLRMRRNDVLSTLIACTLVVGIMVVGTLQVADISSPLVLFLLIPVFVFVAQRGDQYLVLLLALAAVLVLLLSSTWLPADSLSHHDLGYLYLGISLLWVVIFTGMVTSSARQEMRSRERVSWLADHDPLTQLFNRHALMEKLEVLLAKNERRPSSGVLMYLDLDRFKDLNDAEGHRAGDQVLREISVLLLEELRSTDVVARMAGDEFAVILEGCPLLEACSIAENTRSKIERYEYVGEHGHHRVEVSIGLLELAERHAAPEDALHEADAACYEAKRAGRNRVWVYAADT